MGAIPAEQNPHKTIAAYAKDLDIVVFNLVLAAPAPAVAAPLADESGAEWQVEQPAPPPPPPGVQPSSTPIGLGKIGDIKFYAPNRGALITAGNGSSIPAGVWFYNGAVWRELASVCGATDGRIAWAGPDDFWTISDARPGQASGSTSERPPLEDNTLCHFAPGPSGRIEVVASYGSPPFLSTSYQAMHAAGCITPTDCWFGGELLPEPQIGAFQLHWNGHSLEPQPYLPEGHVVRDMLPFAGRLFESVRLRANDQVEKVLRHPPPLRIINPAGSAPQVEPVEAEDLPLYGPEEFAFALDLLHLGGDAESLWAAGGPALEKNPGSEPAGVTVVRREPEAAQWSQVIGPNTTPSGAERFPEDVVDGIAAEPGTSGAWIALDSVSHAINHGPTQALVARIAADGSVSDEAALPGAGDPHGPLGAAEHLVCPASHDCWLTTGEGWLVHLATPAERSSPEALSDPAFAGEEPITFRPLDEGVPQEVSDALPVDNSGLEETLPQLEDLASHTPPSPFATVTVPLLSHVHARLIKGTTLLLSFHLAVKARVRLLAERRRKVVARTAMRTLQGGNRSLRLLLDRRRWPTKLNLQTHALAPLPTASTRESSTTSVSTSLRFPSRPATTGLLP